MNAAPAARPGAGPGDDADPFALYDDMLRSGLVDRAEHHELCRSLAQQLAANARSATLRQQAAGRLFGREPVLHATQPAPTTTSSTTSKDPAMNPHDLIRTMDLQREVMTEQLKALNALPGAPVVQPAPQSDPAAHAAALLNAVTQCHLGAAAAGLEAVASAAARVRGDWARRGASPAPGAQSPETVDVQAVEVPATVVLPPPARQES